MAWGLLMSSHERVLIKDMKVLLESTDMSPLQRQSDNLIGRAIELLAKPEPVAWVWNPARDIWERVRAFGHWQQGAIYAFGDTMPKKDGEGDEARSSGISLRDHFSGLAMLNKIFNAVENIKGCVVESAFQAELDQERMHKHIEDGFREIRDKLNMEFPPYMIGGNAENQVTLTFFNGSHPTTSLFMTSNGVAFLIEELALQIRGEYLIELTKLREDDDE
jgi:hypothetical protein